MLHHGPAHSKIQPCANNCPILSRIILDSYGPYNKFLQNIGFFFPVYISNLYTMIVRCSPYIHKQSQKSLIIMKILSFVG